MAIRLNDILKLENSVLEKTKIRLLIPDGSNDWEPLQTFKNDPDELLSDCFWVNRRENDEWRYDFEVGSIVIGFARLDETEHTWLITSIAKVTKQKNNKGSDVIKNHIGYEYEKISDYDSIMGRVIVKYHNRVRQSIQKATEKYESNDNIPVIDCCEVVQILPDRFDDDIFPGYDRVNLSWEDLARVIKKDTWKTALQNQKGVYLITDTSNGKRYVGSAYGQDMILGRWRNYVDNGHGDNKELKTLKFDDIKKDFRYSILDIFKSTIDDKFIRERESWWKEVLLSRDPNYGYNAN
jgi:uncharacterized protein (UPF0147 family)